MTRASSWSLLVAAVTVTAALGATSVAQAQDVVLSAGMNVRMISGTFGSEQTTRLVYAPVVLRLDIGRVELAGYFPYLTIENGTVAPTEGGFVPMRGSLTNAPTMGIPMMGGSGGMMGPSGPSGSGGVGFVTRRSGFGDVAGSVGFRVIDNWLSGLQLVAAVRFKFPTAAAERGLGTGQTDVTGVVVLRKRFVNGWVYAEGGYLVPGTSADVDLNDAVVWGIGGGRRLARRVYLLASAFGNSALIAQFGAPIEIGAGLGVRLSPRVTMTVIPTVGLSDASPRYALTFGLSSELMRR